MKKLGVVLVALMFAMAFVQISVADPAGMAKEDDSMVNEEMAEDVVAEADDAMEAGEEDMMEDVEEMDDVEEWADEDMMEEAEEAMEAENAEVTE